MFKKIQPDKWRHFYVGILMGLVLQFISWRIFIHNSGLSISIAFIIVVAISYGFELFSKITGMGRYDIMDAVASIIGGIIGMALVLPFQL
jgi:VanZ family protein